MPTHKYTAVHYALTEVLETTAKALSKIRVRINRGTAPTPNEPALNAHYIHLALTNLAQATQSLADEHQTLSPDVVGSVTHDQLNGAATAIAHAASILPSTPPGQ